MISSEKWSRILMLVIFCGFATSHGEVEIPHKDILVGNNSIMLPRSKRETDDPLTSSHNIRFVVPDLSVVHNVNGVDLDLHAYKVEEHHRNNQWVSIGHPVFLKNKNGNIYQFTPESIFMRLQLLSEDQEIALKNMAKKKYPDVEEAFIHLIPLQNIDCTTYLFVSGKKFELHGKAHNLNQYEVTIEIPCEEKSETRRAFYTRIKREDPLNWKCTFTADGKERFVNRIHISAQDIERAVISHTLFGPATEVFVTRNQLTLFSREIRNKLQIEEDYELDEKFDEKLVERLVSLASSTFEDRDIDQVLLKLCKLGFSFDERDLTPNEMKRYLSDLITYHKQGDKEFLSVKNDYKLRAEDDEAATKKAGATLSVGPSYSLGANAEVMKRKVQSLENSNMSVKEQLNEINRDNQFNIKFEFDGSKIVPKTIKVALLNKNDFNRDVSVSYRKIMRKEGRYNKEISISSDCSVDAKDVGEIMTEKLNRIKEGDESLRKRIDIISANLSSLNKQFSVLSSEVKNKLYGKTPFLKSHSIECLSGSATIHARFGNYCKFFGPVEFLFGYNIGSAHFLQRIHTNCDTNPEYCFRCCRLNFKYKS